MLFSVVVATDDMMDLGMVVGFSTMILAFSLIFVAIIKFRNNYNQGVITFGKAFTIGLLIAFIASSIYVVAWLIDYQYFIPDFFEKYTAATIKKMQAAGKPQVDIDKTLKEMLEQGELYKNSVFIRIIYTYLEILPVGIIVSLIAALILKRNTPKPVIG